MNGLTLRIETEEIKQTATTTNVQNEFKMTAVAVGSEKAINMLVEGIKNINFDSRKNK